MKKLLLGLAALSSLLTVAGCGAPAYDRGAYYDDGRVGPARYYYFDGAGHRQDTFFDPVTGTYRPLEDRVLE